MAATARIVGPVIAMVRTAVALTACAGFHLDAQSSLVPRSTVSSGFPMWDERWIPFAGLADDPRLLPHAPPLNVMQPRVWEFEGIFSLRGNPAALVFDSLPGFSLIEIRNARDGGTYRRPLDADDVSRRQARALAIQPGTRTAAIGKVLLEDETLGQSWYASSLAPHASDPVILADSSNPQMRRTRTQLAGAVGRRAGGWGLGAAAGIEVGEHRTVGSRFPRSGGMSLPGVSAGVIRQFQPFDLRIGAQVRGARGTELVSLIPQPGRGVAYVMTGYFDPDRREVVQIPPFFRRSERSASSTGVEAAGRVLGATLLASVDRGSRRNRHFSERKRDPASDRWHATDLTLRGAAHRAIFSDRLTVGINAMNRALEGYATRSDLQGEVFRVREATRLATVAARYVARDTSWRADASVSYRREDRTRTDFLAELSSHIVSYSPSGTIEVGFSPTPTITVTGAASGTLYSAYSVIPDPLARQPVYTLLVAPELSLYATPATAAMGAIAVQWRMRANSAIVIGLDYHATAARPTEEAVPLAPSGVRRSWGTSVGLLLSP